MADLKSGFSLAFSKEEFPKEEEPKIIAEAFFEKGWDAAIAFVQKEYNQLEASMDEAMRRFNNKI